LFFSRFYGLIGFCRIIFDLILQSGNPANRKVGHSADKPPSGTSAEWPTFLFAASVPEELRRQLAGYSEPSRRVNLVLNILQVAFGGTKPYPYMTMNQEQLKEYKTKLERERSVIVVEIASDEKPVDFGSDIDHGDEESDKSEQVGDQLAAARDLKDRLNEINIALTKIQSGTYGVCEKCGKPIEREILLIDPESRFCKVCKLAN
jgi:DnaK suppressor protein